MPFDLIHTHNNNAAALNMAQLHDLVPAAFSEAAAPETSERYGFVNTASAIDILTDHGFYPVRAVQKPSRKGQNVAFNDHMITFAAPNAFDGDGERGELILYNSHNARSSLKLFAGVYRFICSNGLISGQGFEAKLRHSKLTAASFDKLVSDQAENLPAMLQNIDAMKRREISPQAALQFAQDATALRWANDPNDPNLGHEHQGELRGSYATTATVLDVVSADRYEDKGSDVWRILNRAQETLIRGGARINSYTARNPNGRTRTARPIASLAETVKVNRKLWDMADAVA